MNKFVVSLMLAVAMVFGAVNSSNAEETMVKKVDYFTLMMDKSGSMFMRDAETDLLKMYLAKEAVANVFEAVDEKYGFEEGLKTACGYKEYHSGKYTLENVKAFLKNDVPDNGSIFGNMTPLSKALVAENAALGDERSAVILVTDGEYNLGKNPVDVVKDIYAKHPKATVHVISFADTEKGEKTIKQIVDLKEGSCYADGPTLAKSTADAKAFAMAVFFGFEGGVEVFFDRDMAVIKAGEKSKLDAVKGRAVRVEGWASVDGPKDYNQALSQRRAAAVAEYLGVDDFEGKGISTKYKKRKLNLRADIITK